MEWKGRGMEGKFELKTTYQLTLISGHQLYSPKPKTMIS